MPQKYPTYSYSHTQTYIYNIIYIYLPPKIYFSQSSPVHRGFSTIYIFEGSLEVKLPTIWTDEKQSSEEAERRERLEERRVEEKE